jgi:hypothetical protein
MSLEDEVKEAFKKHELDARAEGQSWDAVEKKVRRAHKQRLAYSSALSLVIIAAIAIIVVRSPGSNESRGLTGSSPSPTETATPSTSPEPSTTAPPEPASNIPSGFVARVGVQSGFAVDIPKDWKGGWFEGTWDFEPKGQPSTAEGGNLFAVTVAVRDGSYEQAATGHHATDTTVNVYRAKTWSSGTNDLWYAVDWTETCPGYAPECSSNFKVRTLVLHLFASTTGLWDQYLPTGKEIVSTVHMYDGTIPVHEFGGPMVATDALDAVLHRFLDARVEGVGAEDLMSDAAQAAFADSSNCLDLYQQRKTDKPWAGYEILSRLDQGSGKARFLILMKTDPNTGGYIEGLVVGPGRVNGTTVPVSIALGENSCSNGGD